jgi:hypothetical protein
VPKSELDQRAFLSVDGWRGAFANRREHLPMLGGHEVDEMGNPTGQQHAFGPAAPIPHDVAQDILRKLRTKLGELRLVFLRVAPDKPAGLDDLGCHGPQQFVIDWTVMEGGISGHGPGDLLAQVFGQFDRCLVIYGRSLRGCDRGNSSCGQRATAVPASRSAIRWSNQSSISDSTQPRAVAVNSTGGGNEPWEISS